MAALLPVEQDLKPLPADTMPGQLELDCSGLRGGSRMEHPRCGREEGGCHRPRAPGSLAGSPEGERRTRRESPRPKGPLAPSGGSAAENRAGEFHTGESCGAEHGR